MRRCRAISLSLFLSISISIWATAIGGRHAHANTWRRLRCILERWRERKSACYWLSIQIQYFWMGNGQSGFWFHTTSLVYVIHMMTTDMADLYVCKHSMKSGMLVAAAPANPNIYIYVNIHHLDDGVTRLWLGSSLETLCLTATG